MVASTAAEYKANSAERRKRTLYTLVALLISVSATVYWLALVTHAYRTFGVIGSRDLAEYSNGLYFDIHYMNLAKGVQFITIGNHISPDMLLVLPFFYVFQSSLTLLYIQVMTICLTSFLVFIIVRNLTKRQDIAIVMSIAFLVNPGVTGMLTYGFPIEFILVPAYLLTFYFYMVSNRKMLVVSLLLLLGALEVAPVLAITMTAGLFAYEIAASKSKGTRISKEKLQMLVALMVISVVAGALYYASIMQLTSSYSTTNSGVPEFLRMHSGSDSLRFLSQLKEAYGNPVAFIAGNVSIYGNQLALALLVLSIFIVFLGFGPFTLKRPLVTLLLSSQWFLPVLLWSDKIKFLYTGYMFYGYTIGSTIAASVIGMMAVPVAHDKSANKFKNSVMLSSIIIIAVALSLISLIFAYAPIKFLATYNSQTPEPGFNASNITAVSMFLPGNASLMTQDVILPHVDNRKYIETTASWEMDGTYFIPDYILISHNESDAYTNSSYYDLFERAMNDSPYYIYARRGDAILYKKK